MYSSVSVRIKYLDIELGRIFICPSLLERQSYLNMNKIL